MDLHPYGIEEALISEAAGLLDYQPFRISDSIVTGVAHSWLHATTLEGLNRPQMVFDKARDAPERWHNAVAASERLDRLYQHFLNAITGIHPGGSYLESMLQ